MTILWELGKAGGIEGAGSVGFDPNNVRKVVSVQAPQAVAVS